MSTQTDKIREALKALVEDYIMKVKTSDERMEIIRGAEDALATLSELEAQPSEPRLTVDQIMEIVLEEADASPGGPFDLSIRARLTKAAQWP